MYDMIHLLGVSMYDMIHLLGVSMYDMIHFSCPGMRFLKRCSVSLSILFLENGLPGTIV